MTHEVFVDEWIYRPSKKKGVDAHKLYVKISTPLEPFQLYVVKVYKIVVSKKDDYNVLINVLKNVRPKERKIILDYIKDFLPGKEKIKNIT